jgi:hypothetical protein
MNNELIFMTIKELLENKSDEMLKVNSEYQRGEAWTPGGQKLFIDTILRGYPFHNLILHDRCITRRESITRRERRNDRYEIIDGQQRINAMYEFAENRLKLFHPDKDSKTTRLPQFIKEQSCEWGNCTYDSLSPELRKKFNETKVAINLITTDNKDEVRDIFIRLQNGRPLTPQEKRDAWPGNFTSFILSLGGKSARYPGHDFFKHCLKSKNDRGEIRTLATQIAIQLFENATKGNWQDLGTASIDDYYYTNLSFDSNSEKVERLKRALTLADKLFSRHPITKKLKGYETLHSILLIDSWMDKYTTDWQNQFIEYFMQFRKEVEMGKKERKDKDSKYKAYWDGFGQWTQTQSNNASTIAERHEFFSRFMYITLNPIPKDSKRAYDEVEREVIYERDGKVCAECHNHIEWVDLEIHHRKPHAEGGRTTIDNGVAVHKDCHPRSQAAVADLNQKLQEEEQKRA